MSLALRPASRCANRFNIDERRELNMLGEIGYHFQVYGVHPHCAGCGETCRQPNCPGARIVFCPRMRRES